MVEILQALFKRDLNKLKLEISLYQNERNLWRVNNNIANSAGNLCLHLIGNLNSHIGVQIGKTSYVRHRELEFSLKDIPAAELTSMVNDTMLVVEQSLNQLTPDNLLQEYPLLVFEHKTSTGYLLTHLATHLAYHLGQINYHRRLLDI